MIEPVSPMPSATGAQRQTNFPKAVWCRDFSPGAPDLLRALSAAQKKCAKHKAAGRKRDALLKSGRAFALLALFGLGSGASMAHSTHVGEVHLDHPYATPSGDGERTGAVYFRAIRNQGKVADRLVSAASPIAGSVEIQQVQRQGGVIKTRVLPALALSAGTTMKWMHNTPDGYRLGLLDLKQPLKDGDRFSVNLTFEHGGSHEVKVWVQTPRDASSAHAQGHH